MVRLLIGDRAGETEVLRDYEIATFLDANAARRLPAAADCADAIAALYAGRVDTHVGILSASDSQLSSQYRRLAQDLRSRASTEAAPPAPWAGGLRVADRETRAADDTLVAPFFARQSHPGGSEERC